MVSPEEVRAENLTSMMHIVQPERCARKVDANLIFHLRELYGDGQRSVLEMWECFEARLRGLYMEQISN